MVISPERVLEALHTVKDPEIPTISVVDMGIITSVAVSPDGDVAVTMTPTFVGCPAIDVMKHDVESAVAALQPASYHVTVSFDVPWTTNRLTEAGKQALLKHGLAPPQEFTLELELDVLQQTPCPYCGSTNTELKSPFGPTLCRSLHYCHHCLQAFEGFKPI
ncbi:MAG: phenylacetate-CoA oxygenase subunit PaaJ [Candidatus Kapabacteria bacterium]|jgi:ring-1,2-phenylacetyl-CoA epoxidase subunit PaaD|nr:phenylacetate-CoA oxygenase subunit PaaJ [Candidatus Kapabacteria bacterium]